MPLRRHNVDVVYVCGHLHPEGKRRCQLEEDHEDVAHLWERYDHHGVIIEHYEWIGDDSR